MGGLRLGVAVTPNPLLTPPSQVRSWLGVPATANQPETTMYKAFPGCWVRRLGVSSKKLQKSGKGAYLCTFCINMHTNTPT